MRARGSTRERSAVLVQKLGETYAPRNLWLKRAMDLLVAVPVGLLVLPLIAALALTIKAVDPRPAPRPIARFDR